MFRKPEGHLQVALGLHETAHHSKGAVQISISISRHARDNGVVRTFVWRHTVGVLLIQDEVVAPVLQGETAPLRHNACKQALQSKPCVP